MNEHPLTIDDTQLADKAREAHVHMQVFLSQWQILSGIVTSAPYAREDHLSGPSENNCIWTGYYLMMLCHQFSTSKDETIKQQAQAAYRALLNLREVTGKSYLVARSYRTPESKTPHNDDLDAFFARGRRNFKHEINSISEQSVLTATSKWQMEWWLHGLSTYCDSDMCEGAERLEIQKAVKDVVGAYVGNGYEIIDLDGKPTDQWSHRNSDSIVKAWIFDSGAYLRKLAILKIAHHITQDTFFGDEYSRIYNSFLLNTSGKWIFTRIHPGEALRRRVTRKQNYPSYHLEALAIEALARYEPNNTAFQTILRNLSNWSEKKWLMPFIQGTPSQASLIQLSNMQTHKVLAIICAKPERETGSLRDTSEQGEEFAWRCATDTKLTYPLTWKHSIAGTMNFSPLDFLYAYWKMRAQK